MIFDPGQVKHVPAVVSQVAQYEAHALQILIPAEVVSK